MAQVNYDPKKIGLSPETLKFLGIKDPAAPAEQYGPPAPPQFSPYQAPSVEQKMAAEEAARAQQNAQSVADQQSAFPLPLLPSVEKGSGRSFSGDASDEEKKRNDLKRMLFMSPEQINRQVGAFRNTDIVRNQEQGLANLEAQIKKFQEMRGGQDLRPYAAFVDSMTGSKFMDAVTPPMTPEQRAKIILDYSQKVQQDKRDLSKNILDAAIRGRAGTQENLMEQIAKMAFGQKVQDPNQTSRGMNPVMAADRFNRYSQATLKTNDKVAQELGEAIIEVASGNPIADARLPIIRAKIDAGGRPNIAEVQLEAGDRAMMSRLAHNASMLLSGNMSPKNRELYLKDMRQLAALHQKERDMFVAKMRAQGASQYAQTPEQLDTAYPEGYSNIFSHHISTADKALAELQKGQGATAIGGGPAPAAPAAPAPAQKIKVSNGKESLLIDPSDLPHAIKDGYVEVK